MKVEAVSMTHSSDGFLVFSRFALGIKELEGIKDTFASLIPSNSFVPNSNKMQNLKTNHAIQRAHYSQFSLNLLSDSKNLLYQNQ